jgi:hypothetical protein
MRASFCDERLFIDDAYALIVLMAFIASLPILQIHLTAVFATLALVAIADLHGLLWMMGKMRALPPRRTRLLHFGVWAGLSIIILAGATMFLFGSSYYLSLPTFRIKMLFVAALLINSFFIHTHLKISHGAAFADLPRRKKIELVASGAVSAASWIGAFVCGQLLS